MVIQGPWKPPLQHPSNFEATVATFRAWLFISDPIMRERVRQVFAKLIDEKRAGED
jgi:hypothetical protein